MQSFSDLGVGGGLVLPAGFDEEKDGVDRVDFAGLANSGQSIEVHGFDTMKSDKYDNDFAVIAIVIDGTKATTATGSSPIVDQLQQCAARQDVDGKCTGFPFVATVEQKTGRSGNPYYTFA